MLTLLAMLFLPVTDLEHPEYARRAAAQTQYAAPLSRPLLLAWVPTTPEGQWRRAKALHAHTAIEDAWECALLHRDPTRFWADRDVWVDRADRMGMVRIESYAGRKQMLGARAFVWDLPPEGTGYERVQRGVTEWISAHSR